MTRDNRNHDGGATGPRLKSRDGKGHNDREDDRGQGGRYGMQHYSDEDRRGYGKAYQRELANETRFDQSVHDLQKDGRASREDQ